MHFSAKLASISTLALLAACSSLNPFASNAPKTPPAALVDIKPTMAVRSTWSTSIGNAGTYVFSPALVGDHLYIAAADGSLAQLDANNGRQAWRINAGSSLTAGVGSDGKTIAVAGEKGSVLAFDADGKLRWKAQASSEILSSPAVGQGLVIVRSVDNRIAAYDAETGVRRWFVQRTTPVLTLRSTPGIVIDGINAYVGLPGGKLLALALNNGGVRWEIAVGDPRGATELERVTDISGMPVIIGRDICATTYQGRVGCFDTSGGTTRWSKDLSSDVGIAVDQRFVFAADEKGALSAFSRDAGQSVWRNNKLAYRRLSTPVSYGRAVAVGDFQGYIHFMAREDGAYIARTQTDGSPIHATPLVAGANLIFQTQAGTVAAFGTE